jgi:putative ABC transport system permease protein
VKLATITVRQLRSRKARALLTLLSIMIGIGATISVQMATTNTRAAYRRMSEMVGGQGALEVVAEDGDRFSESLVEQVASTPGVRAALPLLHRPTIVYFKGQRTKLVALGVDPARYTGSLAFELQAGRFFDAGNDIVLDAAFAKRMDAAAGDEFRLLTRRGITRTAVAGIVQTPALDAYLRGESLLVKLPILQAWFSLRDKIDAIRLVLVDDAETKAVIAALQPKLPPGIVVREPLSSGRLSEETLMATELGLKFAVGLSLALAAFIILNTFLMNVSERRTQLAILRAVGATRGQIMRLLLGEALLLGIVGTALGITVGILGARILNSAMARVLESPLAETQLTLGPLLLALVLGPALALLATYYPARRASHVSPLEGMGVPPADVSAAFPRTLTLAALAVFAVSEGLLMTTIAGWLPPMLAIPLGLCALVTFVMLIPAVVRPFSLGIAALLRPIFRAAASLAQRQLTRHRTRTALTSGVVLVAVSGGIGMGNTLLGILDDVGHWYQRTMVADYLLYPSAPANEKSDEKSDEANSSAEALVQELDAIPGVRSSDSVRFVAARVAGFPAQLIVKQFTDENRLAMDLKQGDPHEVRGRLMKGDVVVSTVLATRLGLKEGDEIYVETKSGNRRVRVAGMVNEYAAGGLALYMQRTMAERYFGVEGVDLLLIQVADPHDPKLADAFRAFGARHHLALLSFAELRQFIDGLMGGVVGSFWALLVLGFLVAAFGIVNTLTMNVLQQTRELGLLRVVGMTRSQVRRMVVAQATIIGVIGVAGGTLAGIVIAYINCLCLRPLVGREIEFVLQWPLIAACDVGALVIVVLAAWLPAARASGLDLLAALDYE